MTVHQPMAQFAEAIAPRPNRAERVFGLPPVLHFATAGAYLLFVGTLCAAFMAPELVVPAAIIAISVVAMFVVPGLRERIEPNLGGRLPDWQDFRREGVDCQTGHLSAGEASVQVLMLPAMIVALGFVFVTIAAIV